MTSLRDPIRVNSTGRLRVQFLDSAFEPIEATDVTVDLFAPGLDPDTDTPTTSGLIPTYLGNGVFELQITSQAPEGEWIDRWTGTILETETTMTFRFTVVNSGIITSYPINGLGPNTLVEITLDNSISSTSGTSLTEDVVLRFTTTYTPLYSSVRKVRLDAGGILSNTPDDVINLAILEASIEADVMSFRKSIINSDLFVHARRQYVTCMAANIVAHNLLAAHGLLKSKMLADFRVEYDPGAISSMLGLLQDCSSKWLEQVQAGGGARAIRDPRGVVKGETDPDRPSVGRLWYGVAEGEPSIANTRFRKSGFRRFRSGWTPNKPGGSSW